MCFASLNVRATGTGSALQGRVTAVPCMLTWAKLNGTLPMALIHPQTPVQCALEPLCNAS